MLRPGGGALAAPTQGGRDGEEPTTLLRAVNIRQRTDPPLGAGYVGNGVINVGTLSTVAGFLPIAMSKATASEYVISLFQVSCTRALRVGALG